MADFLTLETVLRLLQLRKDFSIDVGFASVLRFLRPGKIYPQAFGFSSGFLLEVQLGSSIGGVPFGGGGCLGASHVLCLDHVLEAFIGGLSLAK